MTGWRMPPSQVAYFIEADPALAALMDDLEIDRLFDELSANQDIMSAIAFIGLRDVVSRRTKSIYKKVKQGADPNTVLVNTVERSEELAAAIIATEDEHTKRLYGTLHRICTEDFTVHRREDACQTRLSTT